MQIWHFTEEPYPHLPPPEEYNSIRMTLPSRICDPKLGADLYHRYIVDWIAADEEDIDVMLNEHHRTPTCLAPASPLMLAILARARFGRDSRK